MGFFGQHWGKHWAKAPLGGGGKPKKHKHVVSQMPFRYGFQVNPPIQKVKEPPQIITFSGSFVIKDKRKKRRNQMGFTMLSHEIKNFRLETIIKSKVESISKHLMFKLTSARKLLSHNINFTMRESLQTNQNLRNIIIMKESQTMTIRQKIRQKEELAVKCEDVDEQLIEQFLLLE